MLTDDDLRRLLDDAAASAPEPAPLDVTAFTVTRRRRTRALPKPVLVVGVAAAAFVAVLVGASVFASRSTTATKSAAPFSTVANSIGADVAAAPAGAPATTVPNASDASGYSLVPPARGGTASPPADSAKVIKNGTLEVRVAKGGVTESMNRLTTLASGFGGYVSESRTTASSDTGSQASATISVRVPAAAFEQLIAEASKLGEVRSTSTSGQDVTAQFTDIDAQLTALNATRDQFLLVLGEAQNVGDILAVQDRITQVQTQIDQLEGQKRLLTDQTSFGTLSVTFLEPGATLAVPVVNHDTDLGDAWREARHHFVDGVESIVAASGTIVLVALCGGVILLAGWLVSRRLRLRML